MGNFPVEAGVGFVWLYLSAHEMVDHGNKGWGVVCLANAGIWLLAGALRAFA